MPKLEALDFDDPRAIVARTISALVFAAERDGLTIDDGNVVDLVADNTPYALEDIQGVICDVDELRDRFPLAAARGHARLWGSE